jgi:hypothetical protein
MKLARHYFHDKKERRREQTTANQPVPHPCSSRMNVIQNLIIHSQTKELMW